MKRDVDIRKDLIVHQCLVVRRYVHVPMNSERLMKELTASLHFQGGCSTKGKVPSESSLAFEKKGEYDESGPFIVHYCFWLPCFFSESVFGSLFFARREKGRFGTVTVLP